MLRKPWSPANLIMFEHFLERFCKKQSTFWLPPSSCTPVSQLYYIVSFISSLIFVLVCLPYTRILMDLPGWWLLSLWWWWCSLPSWTAILAPVFDLSGLLQWFNYTAFLLLQLFFFYLFIIIILDNLAGPIAYEQNNYPCLKKQKGKIFLYVHMFMWDEAIQHELEETYLN